MESRVKVLGHPIHPVLIVFPLGLLATAVIFDILYLIFGNPDFPIASFWLIITGIAGGLTAALFGLLDWLAIPGGTRAKTIGLTHGLGNVALVTGWLGGELVYRLGMAVDPGANLDAHSSLSGQPAAASTGRHGAYGQAIPQTGRSSEGEEQDRC